jgi:5-methylcytosine-specific restriction endonuclease McrA
VIRRLTPLRARKPYHPPHLVNPIPANVRAYVKARDQFCVGRKVGLPTQCWGAAEIDHVRASEGIGMKSRSTPDNLVLVCSTCHQYKTEHGREVRPLFLAYLASVEGPEAA